MRLDTFGDRSQTEVRGEVDDGRDDALVLLVHAEALHECLVDLDEGDGQATEMGERRVPGAEVVEADLHAEVPDVPELLQDVGAQVDDRGLGELEVQTLRVQSRLLQRRAARAPAGRPARTGEPRG